jgi:hypothetical protein
MAKPKRPEGTTDAEWESALIRKIQLAFEKEGYAFGRLPVRHFQYEHGYRFRSWIRYARSAEDVEDVAYYKELPLEWLPQNKERS